MSNLLIDLAIIPGIILAIMIFKQDKIEKEPIGLLIVLGLAGAATVISALILEEVGSLIIGELFTEGSLPYALIENFIVVACSEEAGKYFVSKKITWKRAEFNYRFDAIVYCACASLGFAIVENVVYALEFGFSTTIMRALTAVPAHTIFGIFMGFYYGQAKYYANRMEESISRRYLRKAYIVPVFLHGLYDFLAGEGYILYFLFFVVAVDIMAIKQVRKSSREDTAV